MTPDIEMTEAPPSASPGRRPLRRSSSDRVLAGVAGGIGSWLDIDPVIVRVVLAVLAVFGGSGLVLYAIGWLLIPSDDAEGSEAEKLLGGVRRPHSVLRTIGIVLLALLALIGFAAIARHAFGPFSGAGPLLLVLAAGAAVFYLLSRRSREESPVAAVAPVDQPVIAAPITEQPATSPVPAGFAYGGTGTYPGVMIAQAPTPVPKPRRPRSYLGLATLSLAVAVGGLFAGLSVTGAANIPTVVVFAAPLAVLALGLLIGSFFGRARWLAIVAVPLTLLTLATALVPHDVGQVWNKNAGNVTWTPTTTSDLTTHYELGTGSGTLDLTRLPATSTIVAPLVVARVNLGLLRVQVPANAGLIINANVGLGSIHIDGVNPQGGRNVAVSVSLPGSSTAPTYRLDLRVSIGQIEVNRA